MVFIGRKEMGGTLMFVMELRSGNMYKRTYIQDKANETSPTETTGEKTRLSLKR